MKSTQLLTLFNHCIVLKPTHSFNMQSPSQTPRDVYVKYFRFGFPALFKTINQTSESLQKQLILVLNLYLEGQLGFLQCEAGSFCLRSALKASFIIASASILYVSLKI
ncbi:hypothetical protein TNIN_131851 [Trichonephila inaurata madagascariensis]|uniref:Uncharacterized protein n=1 Tax=Trichonephila inaurata madagascariensis TaxID=2747483 RepID=A0A8X6JC48_9ARAC|nr:hypothetical protein TNIN_114371 [Trichonephila inaurata madagascariensis]GFY76591.1 hypothetical protein TNIN_131851 [Trichonephila inaurata madagascariensis]